MGLLSNGEVIEDRAFYSSTRTVTPNGYRLIESVVTEIRTKVQELKGLVSGDTGEIDEYKAKKFAEIDQSFQKIIDFQKEKADFVDSIRDNKPILLNVGGENMAVGRKTLTKVEGSNLEALFSGIAPQTKEDDRIFIDRDSRSFSDAMIYIRSGPIDAINLNANYPDKVTAELKFWKLINYDNKEPHGNVLKLAEMLAQVPEDASKKDTASWKKVGPTTIEEILERSGIDFDFNNPDLEFKKVSCKQYYKIGIFKKHTEQLHGIGRIVNTGGAITEAMFKHGFMDGFGRNFFSGGYYIGSYHMNTLSGYGKRVQANGKVEEGIFARSRF